MSNSTVTGGYTAEDIAGMAAVWVFIPFALLYLA